MRGFGIGEIDACVPAFRHAGHRGHGGGGHGDAGAPLVGAGIFVGLAADDEVEGVALLDCYLREVGAERLCFGFPFAEFAGAAADDAGNDAFGLRIGVGEFGGDVDLAIEWGDPAADAAHGGGEARIAAHSIDFDLAGFAVGGFECAFEGFAIEGREAGELRGLLCGGIKGAVTVLPVLRLGMHEVVLRIRGEVFVSALHFLVRGFALEDAAVEFFEAAVIIWHLFGERGGELLGAIGEKRAVHQNEGTRCERGAVAFGGAEVGVGEVEAAVERGLRLAIDKPINGAAHAHVDLLGLAAEIGFQATGDAEQRVAEGFEIKRTHGEIGTLIGGGEHEVLVQLFEAPSILHEPRGEVIEQRLIRGFVTTEAEVARCADDGLAEVPAPHAIDDDADGERIVFAGDGLGELEATAFVFREGLGRDAFERGDELAWGFRTGRVGVAADEDFAVMHFVGIDKGHGTGGCSWMVLQFGKRFGGIAAQAFGDIAVGEEPVAEEVFAREDEGRAVFDEDGAELLAFGIGQRVVFLRGEGAVDAGFFEFGDGQAEFGGSGNAEHTQVLAPVLGPERVHLAGVEMVVEVGDVAQGFGLGFGEAAGDGGDEFFVGVFGVGFTKRGCFGGKIGFWQGGEFEPGGEELGMAFDPFVPVGDDAVVNAVV